MTRPILYLAGPGVFRRDAALYGAQQKSICEKHGCRGLFPLDSELEIDGDDRIDLARRIYAANVAMMDEACAVIADITPFRGVNMDPGTAFEIGYFAARERPIFCWTKDHTSLMSRMRGAGLAHGVNGATDAQGNNIEDFGLTENLMISVSAQGIFDSVEEAIEAAAEHFAKEVRERIMRGARAL